MLTNRQSRYKYSTTGSLNKQENHLVIKKTKKRGFPVLAKGLKIGFFTLLFGLIIILSIHQYAQVNYVNSEVNELQNELAEVEAANKQIRLTIAQGESLKDIEEKARQRYAMVSPDNYYYLYVASDQKTSVQSQEKKVEKNNFAGIVQGVTGWFKNLTSVEAGTLDN